MFEMPPPLPKVTDPGGIKCFLFDLDGTLCDTDPLHHEVFGDLLLKHGKHGGVRIDDAFFKTHIAGKTNEAIFPVLFPESTHEDREAMWLEKEARFRELARNKLTRLPGLTKLLRFAKANAIIVVAVTNAPRANAELMLKALGLEKAPDNFAHVVIGTECARAKPFPDPYAEGMRLAGIDARDAQRCVAFEDSPTGIASACAAGIPTVGVMTSQTQFVLEKAGASVCIVDFEDAKLWAALD